MPKSFATHLAETGQQTRLNELRRTGGFEAAKRAYEGGGAPTEKLINGSLYQSDPAFLNTSANGT